MFSKLNTFLREKVGIFLLLLILIRLVPFNLLHYHNGNFAGFKAIAIHIEESEEIQLDKLTDSCTFHQFLDLINHGFLLNTPAVFSPPTDFNSYIVFHSARKANTHFIYILNKGSPLSA